MEHFYVPPSDIALVHLMMHVLKHPDNAQLMFFVHDRLRGRANTQESFSELLGQLARRVSPDIASSIEKAVWSCTHHDDTSVHGGLLVDWLIQLVHLQMCALVTPHDLYTTLSSMRFAPIHASLINGGALMHLCVGLQALLSESNSVTKVSLAVHSTPFSIARCLVSKRQPSRA
jgi:hypothetical protein